MGLLIKNGTIITATNEFVGDILVEDEKIVEVAAEIDEADHEVVDASGKLVMPGGVDNHVHQGPFDSYTFEETSHAAVAGGTTTIVDFAPQFEGMGVIESKDKHNEETAVGKATPDYSFHGMVMDASDAVLDEIPRMAENGIQALKFFMAYKGTPFYAKDDLIFKAMQKCREHGITVWVHAENGDMSEVLTQQYKDAGETAPIFHSYSNPPSIEDEATQRIIYLAKQADCPLFIVHVTSKGAAQHVADAYDSGQAVLGETCIHYLGLDESKFEEDLDEFGGAKYICGPALRKREDGHQEALWQHLRNGELKAISSDHAAVRGGWAKKRKVSGDNFADTPNGVPTLQSRLHVAWTEGVAEGRITPQKYVELTSTNPAKLTGLYPRKGSLDVGSDADIVIADPNYEGTITFENMHEGTDYALFEGFDQKIKFEKVFLRGRLVAEDETPIEEEKGQGQYIIPEPYSMAYDYWEPREDYY